MASAKDMLFSASPENDKLDFLYLTSAPEWILIGMIKRIHGLSGEMLVKPLTDHPEERFRQGSELHLSLKRRDERSKVRISESRMTDRGPFIKLEGISTREDAAPLFGASLFIKAAQLAEPEPGSYYPFQLEGCDVYQGERLVGVVTGLHESPRANPYLEVDPGGDEPVLMIPFVSEVVTSIDQMRHRIDIKEGFLGS